MRGCAASACTARAIVVCGHVCSPADPTSCGLNNITGLPILPQLTFTLTCDPDAGPALTNLSVLEQDDALCRFAATAATSAACGFRVVQ